MKTTKHNPTMMIKSKFSNQVHRILEPNIEVKKYERWKQEYRDRYKFTDAQKIEMFDEIMKIHAECSTELTNYFADRSYKKWISKERAARGWVSKKKQKMTKAEWETSKLFEQKA